MSDGNWVTEIEWSNFVGQTGSNYSYVYLEYYMLGFLYFFFVGFWVLCIWVGCNGQLKFSVNDELQGRLLDFTILYLHQQRPIEN